MKKLLLLTLASAAIFYGCSSDEDIEKDIPNTENSMLITGISESISYTFSDKNGRTESSVPDDVNMIQILILDEAQKVVYEQYHYNQNAYNHHYYDSADHEGDDYLFENTIPDTLYIPPLADGTYTVLASTTYAYYYHQYNDGSGDSSYNQYPIIESYQVSDAPIYVGKGSAEVSSETDAVVVLDMTNISARIDLNIETTYPEWNLEVQLETGNGKYYSFESEELLENEYDYDYLHLWRDHYWMQESYYFLPRDLKNINLWFYEYPSNFNINFEFDIDPDLTMEAGDVFNLNINLDELVEGGGEAGFNWEDIDWNDLGEVTIP